MKAIEDSRKQAFLIIVRLLIIVFAAVCFHGFRFVLFFVGIIFLLVDLFRLILPHRYKLTLVILDCVIILWILSMYWLYYPMENLRFQLLDSQYDYAVEEILPVLYDAEDTSWSIYKMDRIFPLAVKNEVVYFKHGSSIAIYFSTFRSFFTNAGFIYFSDETARDFFENPSEYDQGLSAEPSYDYMKPYNSNWAYIILY